MTLTVNDLFATPDHYLMAFDGSDAVFVDMDRSSYRRSLFLDGRIVTASPQRARAPVQALCAYRERMAQPRPRTGWIFHVAHCGSTLLARALDREGGPLVLREPMAVRQLAAAAAGAGRSASWKRMMDLTLDLTARRYRSDAPTIVKANVPVNFMLPDILDGDRGAPSLLLYYGFQAYLTAVLRSPAHRTWVDSVTTELQRPIEALVGDIGGLHVAEKGAALWLAQMLAYADALGAYPKLQSLDAETLFARPRETIGAASALFGAAMTTPLLDAVMASDLLGRHAKNPAVAFDNSARLERQAEQTRLMADDLSLARRWLDASPAAGRLPASLGRPLTGETSILRA